MFYQIPKCVCETKKKKLKKLKKILIGGHGKNNGPKNKGKNGSLLLNRIFALAQWKCHCFWPPTFVVTEVGQPDRPRWIGLTLRSGE